MSRRIKRCLELMILIAGLMAVVDASREWSMNRRWQFQEQPEWAALLHEAIWEKYGPGTREAYQNLFFRTPPERFAILDPTEALGPAGGLPTVPEAPSLFGPQLARTEILSASLEQALQMGPFLIPPGEHLHVFASPGLILNLPGVLSAAESLRVLAMRDWSNGNHEKSTEQLAQIFRLGDALIPIPERVAHLTRIALYDIGLDGFNILTWTDPAPDGNQLLLDTLEDIDIDDWRIPRHAGSALWDMATGSYTAEPSVDFVAAALLLHSVGRLPQDESTRTVLHETRIVPERKLSGSEIASRLRKWTTLPAMRRRATHIPDNFAETDPWMPPSVAGRIPRLVYLSSRARSSPKEYLSQTERVLAITLDRGRVLEEVFRSDVWRVVQSWDPSFQYVKETEQRFAALRARADGITAAYRARAWQDEHGRWPTAEEFATVVAPGTSIQWHTLGEPERLVDSFFEKRRDSRSSLSLALVARARDREDARNFHFEFRRSPRMDSSVVDRSGQMLRWVQSILEAQPLVESVSMSEIEATSTPAQAPSVRLTAHLRLPKRSYWVTEPGPDGESDGLNLVYDPSNGTRSRGDIVQLAGWEW